MESCYIHFYSISIVLVYRFDLHTDLLTTVMEQGKQVEVNEKIMSESI